MSKRIVANARVKVMLDINCKGGVWGEECSIGQLQKQAAESALQQLNHMFQEQKAYNISIVGEPEVTGIITKEEK
jgi:hypothetical protein